MKQWRDIRSLALVGLIVLLAGCSQTYSYVPSMGKTSSPPAEGTAAQPGAAAPGPVTAAPPPAPDPAQQLAALEARVQQLEARLAELEASKAAPAAPRGKEAKAAPKLPAPATASYPKAESPGAEKSYNEGLKRYHAKQYGPGRADFSQYLKAHPQGAKGAEARYYLADSFYQEGKYREAAVEFNKMATQNPKSILAPAALLRQGLSYKQQQQTSAYRTTLNKLSKAYPNSPEAKEAQKWLKEEKKDKAAAR